MEQFKKGDRVMILRTSPVPQYAGLDPAWVIIGNAFDHDGENYIEIPNKYILARYDGFIETRFAADLISAPQK